MITKMKKISILFILVASLISCRSTKEIITTAPDSGITLYSPVDTVFYAIGVNYGSGLREGLKTLPGSDGNVNHDAVIAGFMAAMKDDASLIMSAENAQEYIQSFVMEAQMKEVEAAKAENEAFLASNKNKEGVITTESGLQYKVLTEGSGKKPTTEDIVIVHYTGRLIDGTVFESSVERGEPVTFGVTQVIGGWIEGLQLMPVGSKYVFWIPSELAYGGQEMGPIKPYSTLIFELELLGIEEEE